MNKRVLSHAVIFSVILFLSFSCCHKRHCSDFETEGDIELTGFSRPEADTIILYRYSKNFTSLADSTVLTPVYTYDAGIVFDAQPLLSGLDYKLVLEESRKEIFLHDLILETRVCNQCLWAKDEYKGLKEYSVNGVKQHRREIVIHNNP